MSLLKTLLVGRPNGIRSKLFGRKGGASDGGSSRPTAATQPAPAYQPAERALGLKKEAPKDVTPPDGYEVVLHKDALEAGRIIEIIIGGTAIAVANAGGSWYACANTCPHAGGPLGEGSLDGTTVTCPYHGWQFDLKDGSCKTNPNSTVAVYPVQVVGDAVCVRM